MSSAVLPTLLFNRETHANMLEDCSALDATAAYTSRVSIQATRLAAQSHKACSQASSAGDHMRCTPSTTAPPPKHTQPSYPKTAKPGMPCMQHVLQRHATTEQVPVALQAWLPAHGGALEKIHADRRTRRAHHSTCCNKGYPRHQTVVQHLECW